MAAVTIAGNEDLLSGWARGKIGTGPTRHQIKAGATGELRFAFYGRMSTDDFQDRATSLRWQRDVAHNLIAGLGQIVVEFL